MDNIISKLRNLDAYPKINEDFYSRTLSGGVITLASSVVMLLLFISELRRFSLSINFMLPARLFCTFIIESWSHHNVYFNWNLLYIYFSLESVLFYVHFRVPGCIGQAPVWLLLAPLVFSLSFLLVQQTRFHRNYTLSSEFTSWFICSLSKFRP